MTPPSARAPAPLSQRLRQWLLDPIHRHLNELENRLMSTIDDLQAAVDRNGTAVGDAVAALVDQRSKIAALQQAVDAGNLDQARLAAITASIDAASDKVAQALAPVVDDPATPTGDVPTPPAQNPDTPDPAQVDGSVPADTPLPDAAS